MFLKLQRLTELWSTPKRVQSFLQSELPKQPGAELKKTAEAVAPTQAEAETKTNMKLQQMQTAKPTGQDAEQDVPKAATAD